MSNDPHTSGELSAPSKWQTCMLEVLTMIYTDEDMCWNQSWPDGVSKSHSSVNAPLRVCSAWRKAALATPQLWSNIDCDTSKLTQKSLQSLSWWLSLTRGARVYLDIRICHTKSKMQTRLHSLHEFKGILFARARDWQSLTVDSPGKDMLDILHPKLLSRAVQLKRLSVINIAFQKHRLGCGDSEKAVTLPKLENLELTSVKLDLMTCFTAPQLVCLTLRACFRITARTFIEFASNMPSLQYVRFKSQSFPSTRSEDLDLQYHLPSLKTLFIECDYIISWSALEMFIRDAPMLERLDMFNAHVDDTTPPRLSEYPIRHFSNTTDLVDNAGYFVDWKEVATRSPNLQTLETLFYDVNSLPPTLPAGLVKLDIHYYRYWIHGVLDPPPLVTPQFPRGYIASIFQSIPLLETLRLTWSVEYETHEISFTPFLDALASRSDDGTLTCSRLSFLDLNKVSVDDTILLEVSRLHSEAIKANRPYGKEDGKASTLRDEFRVSLNECFLLPQVNGADYTTLKHTLETADIIEPPFNPDDHHTWHMGAL